MFILITGNPVGGLFFYGPYKTSAEAMDAGEREDQDYWWVAPLSAEFER